MRAVVKKKSWIERHVSDPFVKKAQREGYVSRAAYKLLLLQEKDRLFKSGMTVIDLGAAPGGWSQVAKKFVGDHGKIIAVDLLPLEITTDIFIQGDFNDDATLQKLTAALHDQRADVLISDMAPNLTGQKSIDMPRSIHLLELALDCANQVLKPKGTFLFKAFHGAGLEIFVKTLKLHFKVVKYRKPEASRAESAEVYVLALDFHPGYNGCDVV
ncbi:MAG: 23S rRNA methyltransferase [Gammaproteobacteria bacterium RIFCSPLOWO2_02_FULL_42_14]|nr:MAG: 23S rRNA methyltransferase [Gammaproteobacteria bacterium RIFCSPHIGHO2_02_FULL_42_43]OGT28818.1 MAG: 23S rRNA methyltransferase [Gammaproteobacteria bacterium RIFCSPHIGHO2_01_FULL_42_8]OGT52240.1 MAG: 23S rRNA methyltransferase [Gammaproteobacteria bacterium RIFCSPHIGHO2_12_FULL_41_25]OGT61853.1 MAG: 23S rRNA methyltransferase [Gammaproteobacteria bacterium RIFCSPLOWO2_02_FULL_42_14]OGT86436.1 MAG: 23S rRNA methyltransferase [Gammaproteobacteria bacterium RIFCSPLOWO2_12_FULL_42_18]